MWSCFEDFVIKKIMAQSKFDLDARFDSYNFLIWICMYVDDVSIFCLLMHACADPF